MTNKPIFYIAGPMTGRPEFNYPAFRRVAEHLRSRGANVNSPHELFEGTELGSESYQYYLKAALDLMLASNRIVLLDGWNDSKGARLEDRISTALEYPSYRAIISGGELTIWTRDLKTRKLTHQTEDKEFIS